LNRSLQVTYSAAAFISYTTIDYIRVIDVFLLAKITVTKKHVKKMAYFSANTSPPITKLANKVGGDVFLRKLTGDGQRRPPPRTCER
jgi:hypothetical protein